jgi:N-acyl-D-amino-acid deacylase
VLNDNFLSCPRIALRTPKAFLTLFLLPISLRAADIPPRETDPARVVVTGEAEPNLEKLDLAFRRFVASNRVPGMSVAITQQQRLLYAKGFGYADLEKHRPVTPVSQFRIASMSKPITATAVLQLVEKGKLKLNDSFAHVLKLEPKGDPRLAKVTIMHLLQHRGGWDRDVSYDPMFIQHRVCEALKVPLPANTSQIIHYMMTQRLDLNPGERYAYSNFGYCVLGRVIEKVSGESYEAYGQKHVLAPLGIHDMRIGHSLAEQRAPSEVHYYDEHDRKANAIVGRPLGRAVPAPYGEFYLESLDAHGGWIASAVDMVRFCSSFDDPRSFKLIRPESYREMFGRPLGAAGYLRGPGGDSPRETYYGFGWNVRPLNEGGGNFWHAGSLPGTSTLMVHRNDRFDWVVLCNTRGGAGGKELADLLDPEMHTIVDSVRSWPRGNLFPKLLSAETKGQTAKAK